MDNNIIEIKKITKFYQIGTQVVKALQGVDINISKGEYVAIMGPSGSGKSTLMNIIGALDTPTGGQYILNGTDVSRMSDDNLAMIRNKEIGFVFQTFNLLPRYTALENVMLPLIYSGVPKHKRLEQAQEALTNVSLSDRMEHKPNELSGGQRRRIDIARALFHKPKILILDEPTTGLDPQTRQLIWTVISGFRKSEDMTVFLTTHYMEEAAEADYVVIIDDGKISAEGTPLELKNIYTGDYITIYGVEEKDIKALNIEYERIRNGYRLSVPNTKAATELIIRNPQLFDDYEITKGKMDDVFLAVTGKTLVGGAEK